MARVAAIQMISSSDVGENLQRAEQLLREAASDGAMLAVLPEMFVCIGDREHSRAATQYGYDDKVFYTLRQLASELKLWILAGAVPFLPGDSEGDPNAGFTGTAAHNVGLLPYSHSALINDNGDIVAGYNKIHLFDVDVGDSFGSYRESETFSAGDDVVVANTPLGKLGLSVCYDLRFPELYRKMFANGVDIIAVPSAFTWLTGQAHWEVLLRARAIENNCFVVAANQGGKHSPKRQTWGHSCIIDPWGELLASLQQGEGVISAEIDLQRLVDVRKKLPCREHSRLID